MLTSNINIAIHGMATAFIRTVGKNLGIALKSSRKMLT